MGDTIYAVGRHDDDYYGPHRSRYARSVETALELAREERGEHRADDWRGPVGRETRGRESMTFYPDDGVSGWVSIREATLHE